MPALQQQDVAELAAAARDLRGNMLTGSIPDTWLVPGAMPQLQNMYLDNNLLSGTLSADWAREGNLANVNILCVPVLSTVEPGGASQKSILDRGSEREGGREGGRSERGPDFDACPCSGLMCDMMAFTSAASAAGTAECMVRAVPCTSLHCVTKCTAQAYFPRSDTAIAACISHGAPAEHGGDVAPAQQVTACSRTGRRSPMAAAALSPSPLTSEESLAARPGGAELSPAAAGP